MLPFRSVFASLVLPLALTLILSACGPGTPKDEPAPVPPAEGESPAQPQSPSPAPKEETSGKSFLNLLPPKIHPPREPEKPVFHIYYDLEGIPDNWIEEWKAGRDLKVDQRPLPTDPAQWPKDADLVIAPPDRLVHKHLKPFPAEAPPARANPVFLYHPFDPGQTLTRPWRWTPWVVMKHVPAEGSPAPTPTPAAAEPAWPDRPEVARGWWLKTQHLSANHPMNAGLVEKWQAQLARISPAMQSVDALWNQVVEGKIPSALLPLAWKLRQTAAAPAWSAPATGTLIHIDMLALGCEADQTDLVLEWVSFLSDPQRQKALTETTGYYPVQRPLGREVPDVAGPPPAWWDKSEFLVGPPPPPKPPAVAIPVENPKPAQPAEGQAQSQAPAEKPEEVKPAAAPVPVPDR